MKLTHTLAAIALTTAALLPQTSAATTFAECNSADIVFFDGNIVEAAIATPELSTLVTAVTAAGLGDALAAADGITVFAPTDDAFGKLPTDVLNAALADTDLLTGILLYHVTDRMVDPRKYIPAVRFNTLADQAVFVHRKDGEQRVNNSVVTCSGVRTSNGMVWLIDSVLMPQS